MGKRQRESSTGSDWELAKLILRRPWSRAAKIGLAGVAILPIAFPLQLISSGSAPERRPFEDVLVAVVLQTVLAIGGFFLAYVGAGSNLFGTSMGQLTVLTHRPSALFRANMVGAIQAALVVLVLMTPMTVFVVLYESVAVASFVQLALCALAGGLLVIAAIIGSDVCWGRGCRTKMWIASCWCGTLGGPMAAAWLSTFGSVVAYGSAMVDWFAGQTVLLWLLAIGVFAAACVVLWRTLLFADVHYLDWRAEALEAAENLRERKKQPPMLFHRSGTRQSRSLWTRFPFAEAAWLERVDASYPRSGVFGVIAAVAVTTGLLSYVGPRLVFEGDGIEDPLLFITDPLLFLATVMTVLTATMLSGFAIPGPILSSQWIVSEANQERLELLVLTRPVRAVVGELMAYTLIATMIVATVTAVAYLIVAVQLVDPFDPGLAALLLLVGVPLASMTLAVITLGVSLHWSESCSGDRLLIGFAAVLLSPLSVWVALFLIRRGLAAVEAEPTVFVNARREAAVRERLSM